MAEKKQWHETLHDQFGQYFAVDNVLYGGTAEFGKNRTLS